MTSYLPVLVEKVVQDPCEQCLLIISYFFNDVTQTRLKYPPFFFSYYFNIIVFKSYISSFTKLWIYTNCSLL